MRRGLGGAARWARAATKEAGGGGGGGGSGHCGEPVAERPQFPDKPVTNEPVCEHRARSIQRAALSNELSVLCRCPEEVPIVIGPERSQAGEPRCQVMPFDHRREVARYYHAHEQTVERAVACAVCTQRQWQRVPFDTRIRIFEKAADLLAGEYRQKVIAGAVLGQGMSAIQAELDGACKMIDHLRYNCHFVRELCKYAPAEGAPCCCARNVVQLLGLEGFFAAITSHESIAMSGDLAVAPALMGNCVVWKPSDYAVLACYRVLQCLLQAGLPPGVINFVPAEERTFARVVIGSKHLAGINFSGTSDTLQELWRATAERVQWHLHFPRILGNGSGKNFHLIHSSANVASAVACTVRAAFEYSGQRSTSCSLVFVPESLSQSFNSALVQATQALVVCHPLDYRCFTSSLVSAAAYCRACSYLDYARAAAGVSLMSGGRADAEVGYYVEPTVLCVRDPADKLLREEARGPLLALHTYKDCDLQHVLDVLAQGPYAYTGAVFAQDLPWLREAVAALGPYAGNLYINDKCSADLPGHQPLGGFRKSGTGIKFGGLWYLLQFSARRTVKENFCQTSEITYPYMDECPPCVVQK